MTIIDEIEKGPESNGRQILSQISVQEEAKQEVPQNSESAAPEGRFMDQFERPLPLLALCPIAMMTSFLLCKPLLSRCIWCAPRT